MHLTTERTTITLPKGLRNRAHAAGINISRVSAIEVSRRVKLFEKETGEGRQAQTPATATCKGRAS